MSIPPNDLAARLRRRRPEIEEALLARTSQIRDRTGPEDPEHEDGFRAAVSAAFEYSLTVIELGEGDPPPIPIQILAQARLAARYSVGLDTVLRRYVAGSALLDDFMLDELGDRRLQPILRFRASALEFLLSKVSSEYASERERRSRSRDARNMERVLKVLRGELVDASKLGYDLDLNHIGLAAEGPRAREVIGELSKALDVHHLMLEPDDESVWAWLGRRGALHVNEVEEAIANIRQSTVALGLGETADGITGWRQTHRQARAALAVALKSTTNRARYADVCLVASAMQDDLLSSSLKEMYLRPLLSGRDGGATHLHTLRAYFRSQRNGESTASSLGISRQAVANRLRVVEERLGRPLSSCATAMELALKLERHE